MSGSGRGGAGGGGVDMDMEILVVQKIVSKQICDIFISDIKNLDYYFKIITKNVKIII